MKKFNSFSAGLLILLFTLSCTSVNNPEKVSHYLGNNGFLPATIKIPGYKDSLKIIQITDAHISIADEKEADMMQYGERMHKAYMNPRKHYSLVTSETTFEYLDDILQNAKKDKVELLLLTGDIVNFPSAASVKYVYDRLNTTGIPWLYISGNHDWHYEGLPGTSDSLREVWTKKSLLPLYNGLNPLFYSTVIKGINFVGIDNSTSKVNESQIGFMKDQLKKPEPIVILSHIPYNLNNKPSQQGMATFMDVLTSNSNKIIAVLTGHNHRFSFYFTGNLCQYSTLAAFQGASYSVNIKAAD